MNKWQFFALTLSLGAVAMAFPVSAYAQQEKLGNVTFDLQDAPIRSTIEAAFKQAGINNYLIDNNVVGFVTLKITEQPFEIALKLIMRAASVPLTYTKENGVWIVKPRTITPPESNPGNPPTIETPTTREAAYERINLTYLDPMDLNIVLGGLTQIRFYSRFQNGRNTGGMGGGMGMGGMGMGGMGMGGMGMGGMGMGGMGMGGMGMGGMGMGGMGMGGMGGGMMGGGFGGGGFGGFGR